MGATHFLTKRLPKVATEMALNVLAYNIKRALGGCEMCRRDPRSELAEGFSHGLGPKAKCSYFR
jgi:hypothetical protein